MTNKEASITKFLERLSGALDPSTWMTVDHWDADLHAIGVARTGDPTRLVYVSTWGQEEGQYAFDCEAPDESPTKFKVVRREEAASFDTLLSAISTHLFS